ncbi:MAG: hypothetical protein WC955_05675 [Elusimicrobiota bacterium]
MKIDLTEQELNIILDWSEDATTGFFSGGDKVVTLDEDKLIKRLEEFKNKFSELKKNKN